MSKDPLFMRALYDTRACTKAIVWAIDLTPKEAWKCCPHPGWLLFAKLACTSTNHMRGLIRTYVKVCNKLSLDPEHYFLSLSTQSAESACDELRKAWKMPKTEKAASLTCCWPFIKQLLKEEIRNAQEL